MTDREILAAFSDDYAAARARFRQAAREAGWQSAAHETGDTGPDGAPLTIDFADSGSPEDARPLVIVSSGLHGVEGHFGSAVQVAAMRAAVEAGSQRTPARFVFIHALNPYGFVWSRRTDASNVDLNRAFRWPGMTDTSTDASYRRLDALLNPPRPPSPDFFRWRLIAAAARVGPSALRRVIASGQRAYPRGIFFGGTETPALQPRLDVTLPALIGSARVVTHVDLHTGLGRRGEASLIVDYRLTNDDRRWWQGVASPARLQVSLDDPKAYTAAGSLGQWCMTRALAPAYRFAFAEFGTFDGISILTGLRAENQAHHWDDSAGAAAIAAKARLRQLFCPDDEPWRIGTVRRALGMLDRIAHAGAPA